MFRPKSIAVVLALAFIWACCLYVLYTVSLPGYQPVTGLFYHMDTADFYFRIVPSLFVLTVLMTYKHILNAF